MNIDPKQIAKMITEDPDEVNPLDNIEDRYLPTCDICGNEDPNTPRGRRSGLLICPNCKKSEWYQRLTAPRSE